MPCAVCRCAFVYATEFLDACRRLPDHLQRHARESYRFYCRKRSKDFLRTVELGACALKPEGRAVMIKCASKEIADRIVADQRAAKYCRRAGSLRLVVPEKSEAEFRRAAHALGYAPSLPGRPRR